MDNKDNKQEFLELNDDDLNEVSGGRTRRDPPEERHPVVNRDSNNALTAMGVSVQMEIGNSVPEFKVKSEDIITAKMPDK